MAGILDTDPQTQGLLAAAFAGLQASGPSRLPVSLGQVLGASGTAGMEATANARRLEADLAARDMALKKAKLDLELQQQFANGGILSGANDPDMMEALGTKMSLAGHPGGAALIQAAQKIRQKKAAEAQLATMKSVAGVQPDPQELEQAADQGTPVPKSTPAKPGIFGSLAESSIPQIAAQAKAAQEALDKQPEAASISPQHWMDLQTKLASQEAALLSREANVSPNVHPVKDASSSTGWSYADMRKGGEIIAKNAPPPAAAVQQQAAALYTPETIDQLAQRYRLDGTLPPAGMGASGNLVRARIINRAADMARAEGSTGESERIRQVGFKANQQALGQLEKQRNLVLAFEKNALANADIALAQSEKVDRVGSPAIDRWLQAGQKSVAGDVEVAKLDAAIRTFVNEYAKVTSSVTGGGVTSDTARREIDELLKSSMTKGQVRGVIELMKREMKNRELAYAKQVDELKASMRLPEIPKEPGAPPQEVPAAPTPPSPQQIDDLLKKYGRKSR